MKKILEKILSGALLLGAFACNELEQTIYVPENAVSPVLKSIDVAQSVLVEDGTYGTATFTPANYGMNFAVQYVLYADPVSSDFSSEKKVASLNYTDQIKPEITIKANDLNAILISAGLPAGEEAEVNFRVKSVVQGENGAVSGIAALVSNGIAAKVTPFEAEKEYPKVWLPGTANGWNHQKAQHLFNFAEDEVTYQGVTDFGEDYASNQFKITGAAGWDNETGNWGVADPSAAAESASLQLLNGSNDNISQYTGARYYHFTFDQPSLVLKMDYSFNQVGVIGLGGDWDNDVVMQMNSKQVFYADVDVASATKFKFRLDAAWGTNWGGSMEDLKNNGDDIPIEAGKYRIYLNLNNSDKVTCSINPDMYGKDEDEGGEEPVPAFEGWSVTGAIAASGINWDGDIDMTQAGEFWSVKNVTIAASDQFKFRKAHDWAENIGATGDVEPFVIAVGESYEGTAGGKNLGVPADGSYDLYLNPDTKVFYVMATGDVPAEIATWGVVGSNINNWGSTPDLVMEQENGLLVRKNITLTADSQFKIRYQNNWDINRGAPGSVEPYVMSDDKGVRATDGGKNLGVAEDGSYDVWYDEANEILYVVKAGAALPQTWGVVGDFTSWGGDPDRVMVEENGMLVARNVDLLASNQYKVRFNSGWDVNRGAPGDVEPFVVTLGEALTATQGGKNMAVPEDGSFDIYYDQTNELLYTVKAGEKPNTGEPEPVDTWGLVGDFNGWGGDIEMTEKDGVLTGYVVIGYKEDNTVQKFKIRKNAAWDVSVGGTLVALDTPFEAVSESGPDIAVPEIGAYKVVYDTKANTITVSKVQGWSVIGAVGGSNWDKDFVMTFDGHGKWVSEPVAMTDASKFKVRFNASWADADTRGAEADGFAFTVGTAFKVVSPGKDIAAPAAGTYTVTYDSAAEEVTVTAEGSADALTIKNADDWAKFVVASAQKEYGKDETVTLASDITVTTLVDTLYCNFDGGNHTITYSFDQDSNGTENSLGLFRVVNGTQVKNVNVTGTLNTLAAINIGGVVGHAKEGSVIDHCVSNVTIIAAKKVTQKLGGIVGWAAAGSKIINCVNKAPVGMFIPEKGAANASQIGGIVGHIEGSVEVTSCTNEGQVTYEGTGTPRIGGICGYINNLTSMTFKDCTNKGSIVLNEGNYTASSWSYVGGLTGYYGTPTQGSKVVYDGCVNEGPVTANVTDTKTKLRMGGIASHAGISNAAFAEGSITWEFKNCTNKGDITSTLTSANNHIGGILGIGETTTKVICDGCTNSGKITVAGNGNIGGIMGQLTSVSSSYTNFTVSKETVIEAKGGKIGIVGGNNSAFTTAPTGKVAGTLVIGGETTVLTSSNYQDHLFGGALGEGCSTAGVTFGN
mgnify:CR=1 FL=1